MAWEPRSVAGERPRPVPTPDELVVHLREAGAKCVYLSRGEAFREGTIPITATYELSSGEVRHDPESETVREMLTNVFDTIGDRIWFHDREWSLDENIEPALTDSQLNLIPLYDRRVEQKHGQGFNFRNLLFVYEEYRE